MSESAATLNQLGLPWRQAGEAKPFLKWAGGKRQLLSEILPRVPANFNRYFEPFLGAGALFFALTPQRAVLADSNERLIRAYRGIRDDPAGVVGALRSMANTKEVFMRERARSLEGASDVDTAVWLIYLNRTAFNGLYRVNKEGRFNVPYGSYHNPRICDPETLFACSKTLALADLRVADFEMTVAQAEAGDFVYFDPPYLAASRYSDFARYTPGGFSRPEHVRLRDVAQRLKSRGVAVLLSNADTPEVRELYQPGFRIESVSAARFINSRAGGRGKVPEVLIS